MRCKSPGSSSASSSPQSMNNTDGMKCRSSGNISTTSRKRAQSSSILYFLLGVSERYTFDRPLNDPLLNLVFQTVQRGALKYDQPRRVRIGTAREGDGEYVFRRPSAAVRHVEFSLHPNGRTVILRVQREPQTIVEWRRVADMRAESGEEGARCPSTLVLITIL